MITIHHEKETNFSKNGYGAIDDYVMSQEVTWEMNGQFYAYLEYPAFLDKSAYLVNKNILRVPVPFMEDQLFRIYRVRKVLGFIQVEARHIFYDLMDNLIEDTNIVGKTGSQAIQQLLGATQYEHRFIGLSDISTSNNARMVRYNPVEALLDDSKANTFVSRWGGEIVRDNFLIRMARQMGTDRGVRIQHRKDLTAYIATIDESTVVTRIMPVGFDGLKLPELYIDSPLLDPDNPKIGVIRYENVKAAIGEYADDNGAVPLEEAYELLREHARAEFNTNHLDEPEMTVTVNFVTLHNTKEYAGFAQLQEIHQGDVVRVSVPEEGFEITSRLVAFTSDPLQQNHYTSTTLGNHVYEFTSSTNSVSTLRNEVEALRESVVEVRQSANGKNQSFWGEADPNTLNLNAILGDTYFRSVGEEDVIYQYVEVDGERYWKEIIDTSKVSIVAGKVEEVEQQAKDLTVSIEASDQKANEAKEEAGLAKSASEAAEAIAQQAQAEAESANTNSSEALEKAILAGTDAETAKQNALDAVSQASTAKQDANDALGKAGEAVIKANDAIGKANQIPQDIQNEIESKGLVSGSWVESHVDDVTGEINYALAEVSGSIPMVILGVVWDKSENPIMTRTDYVEEYANLTDYLLKTNEIDFNIDGLSGRMSTVETKKLDSTEFTSFKTNDYDVTVSGFRTALTDKLDTEAFNTFKTNEFEMTVEGINGSIESLETEKLDSADFNTFKSNEYELTVDGLRMDLSSVSGSIPTVIMGVEWDKSQSPELTRTDYLEYDNPNLYSPSFIMGVRWDKSENPTLYRTDDTGGVDDYEYSQQTAQFVSDISGISGRVESVETNKLGANEFNSFKTNTYAVDIQGLRTNISSLDEEKLGSDEFSNFKTNEFDVSVNGLSGRIGTVETEKLDSETYETFKTNTYDVDVSGLKSRMSSVETEKLDSGTFNTFKDTTYSNTIEGINGSISSLQEGKLDNQDFNSFKQNEYEVTVDGLKMGLTDVQGAFPTIVLGVEWDKTSDPTLARTDFSEVDNPNLYAPSFVMGVMWDKKESPAMYRTDDTGGVGDYEFTALQADYEFTKSSWSTRLTQIENADYATKTWSNQTFATPQSVTTQLQSYAKTTDLNGMVTETTLATKNFITAGSVNTLLTSYAKTGDVPTATQFNSLKNRYDSMEQIIGTDKDSVARAVMTSSLWETEVSKVIDDELEQEYKTVTSKVSTVDGGKDINNGEGTGEGRYFYFNNSDGVVEGTLSRNATYTLEFSTQSYDNKGNAITLQVKPYGTTEWQPIVTGQMVTGTQISTFTFKNNVFASSISDYRLLISNANGENVPYIWGFKLYKEVEVEVPIEGTNTGAISSKITQLYNMINLSILGKDGAMSRIAMGEEGIQIDGKLLHITAKTYIDEAVIKSAMIDTLDAGKITTGELNASLIRVVNLDANSIAGNEASFIRAMFSGTKSTLQITGSGVSVLDNLGRSSTYLDSSGIEFSRQGVNLGKLEYVTNIVDSGDLNNMHGFSMRPNRNSYFGISYFPSTSAPNSIRSFAVSGRTGNVYISGLIKPSEQQVYGLDITWGYITGRDTNVRIYNHDRTGGIHIGNGDLSYLTSNGWRSLNNRLS